MAFDDDWKFLQIHVLNFNLRRMPQNFFLGILILDLDSPKDLLFKVGAYPSGAPPGTSL